MSNEMLYAKITGQDFINACEGGVTGRIHSVFEHAANIEIKNQPYKLLTLISKDLDKMSANLVVDLINDSWKNYLKVNDKIILTKDVLYVENYPLISGISKAKKWRKVFDDDNVELKISNEISSYLCMCVEVEDYIARKKIHSIAFPEIHIQDIDPLDYLGNGLGLTPSGDDFLSGLLHGIHFMEEAFRVKCVHLPRVSKLILSNLDRTGTISQHFLNYSLKSQWSSSTEDFLVAFINKDIENLFKSIDKKLTIGASSGFDELNGCLYGIKEYIRNNS